MRIAHVVQALLVYRFLYPFGIRYMGLPEIDALYVSALVPVILLASLSTNRRREIAEGKDPYAGPIFAIMLLIILSAVINGSHPYVVFKASITYYLGPLFLYLLISSAGLTNDELSSIVRLCYGLIVLQIPVSLAQYLFGNYTTLDSHSGTLSSFHLGGTGIAGLLMAFLVARESASILLRGMTKRRAGLILLAFIPVIVGGVRFGVVLLPSMLPAVVGAAMFLKAPLDSRNLASIIGMLLLYGVAAAALILVVIPSSPAMAHYLGLDVIFDPEVRQAYDAGAGRLTYYSIILREASESLPNLLLGFGSETVASSTAIGTQNYWAAVIQEQATTAVSFLLSLGLLGVGVLMAVLITTIATARRAFRCLTESEHQVEALSIIAITLAALAGLPYTAFWSGQTGIVYWTLVAVLVRRLLRAEASLEESLIADEALKNARFLNQF